MRQIISFIHVLIFNLRAPCKPMDPLFSGFEWFSITQVRKPQNIIYWLFQLINWWIMEQIQNPRSVDSQPFWLKSVRYATDWLDLTNPWLKEVIWTDPELIFSILYGEFFPLSLLNTFCVTSPSLEPTKRTRQTPC